MTHMYYYVSCLSCSSCSHVSVLCLSGVSVAEEDAADAPEDAAADAWTGTVTPLSHSISVPLYLYLDGSDPSPMPCF